MSHQEQDRYIVRFPSGWRNAIKYQAARNRRSMNQEILAALESVVSAATEEVSQAKTSAAASSNNAALQGGASITHDERTV